MNVISASSLAPDDVFCVGIEFRKAYWAIAGYLLSVAGRLRRRLRADNGSIGEDTTEFLWGF